MVIEISFPRGGRKPPKNFEHPIQFVKEPEVRISIIKKIST